MSHPGHSVGFEWQPDGSEFPPTRAVKQSRHPTAAPGQEPSFPAFLRRCLLLEVEPPGADELVSMVRAQLPALAGSQRDLVEDFLARAPGDALARDQLLNAVFLTTSGANTDDQEARQGLIAEVWHRLAPDG